MTGVPAAHLPGGGSQKAGKKSRAAARSEAAAERHVERHVDRPGQQLDGGQDDAYESGQKATILLVDDHPANLLALEAVLADLGEEIVQATSGEEALKRLLEDDFAVVLLDVKMPGIDGYETAALIRAREKTRDLPIIFLTAYGEESAPMGYSLGAADYMYHPVPPHALKAKVAAFTALWKNRQQLIRAQAVLEQRVQERTAELGAANEELRRRAQLLEETNRQKDEFLAMLAHELRNPLAPILNAVEVMRLRPAGDRVVERARAVIERQVQQQARLLDDLLNVSRITRGKIELRKAVVELASIIKDAVQTVSPLMQERGHQLSASLPAHPAWLDADPTRLEQVFTNLLNNAAKYSPPGSRIRLTAEQAGETVVVRLRDTGDGIAPEILPQIFDLFVQAERPLGRTPGGLGIGLTVVKSLVELHGGTVAAHSDGPGQGSEFTVTLPILASAPASGSAARSRALPGLAGPGLRVLVAEDNPDGAEMLTDLLRLWGCEVQVAHDGPSAVERAAAFHPDAVLLDLGLPRMSGYEVARRLRKDPELGGIVIIAVTGYTQPADLTRSHEAGIDLHLAKPIDTDRLQQILAGVPRR